MLTTHIGHAHMRIQTPISPFPVTIDPSQFESRRSNHNLRPCFTTERGGRCTLRRSALPSLRPFSRPPGSLPRNPGICLWSYQLQAGSLPLPRSKAPPPWELALSPLRYQKLGRSDQLQGAAEGSPSCPRALACPYQLPAPARCIPGRGLIQTLA